MIKLFLAVGSKIGVGIIVMIVTFSFALIALVDGFLLLNQSDATLEQLQQRFQSTFINNSAVCEAAPEVATADISETLRSGTYQQ
ncbi:unnamed protein product [Rotaria sp. Silwood1]|nr:unnamed protein product [Rotaria sp. Silwood1]CAF3622332.1 unnamed protein product [Rotaria sp. Silwood1]CAF4846298.1 unnamed protein product [Rotaria sp. Silwood1]CAF5006799.1 unnamed protein product [Rotaria sp. Silwood1]